MALPESYGHGRLSYMSPMSRPHRDKAGVRVSPAAVFQIYSNRGGLARV